MPLEPGTRLGAHEIVGLLGAGGMGEVYRATDTRLKRDVAIKVCPSSCARSDRVRAIPARGRAPRLAQSSQHRRDLRVEHADGVVGIVLELVEGDTLADVVARGRSRSSTRCRSRIRLPKRSKRRTTRASSTAI
jgi:serine/threonine protein kinase